MGVHLTWSAIYGSQICYSHKWLTVLVRKVKGKSCSFEANLCASAILLLKHIFNHNAFYNKRLQMLFNNSTDPRRRVPLNCRTLQMLCIFSNKRKLSPLSKNVKVGVTLDMVGVINVLQICFAESLCKIWLFPSHCAIE